MVSRIETQTILPAVTSATLSEKFLVEDFRHLVLTFLLTGATSVIKVKASNAFDVDFSSPSTPDNFWYYVDLVGLGDGGTTVTGSTGVSTTTETSQKGWAINSDTIRWIAVEVATLSAGSVAAILSKSTNQ